MFLKFFPVAPHRLIRLLPENLNSSNPEAQRKECYNVGSWFPTADNRGYFRDMKPVVAVGAMVGFLGSNGFLRELPLDMSEMVKRMKSTANVIGDYDPKSKMTTVTRLSKSVGSATIKNVNLPFFLGCKQIDNTYYQARPLYVLRAKNPDDAPSLRGLTLNISRQFTLNRELMQLQSARDASGQDVANKVELKVCSLVESENYWQDSGIVY
jgi:hypothetical protein